MSLVDVPFMAQTEALCGGAAAAMVLRYWGVDDVQPLDFASLVDFSKGGISTGDLVGALTARGFAARPISAESADVVHEIGQGRPVIALIDAGRGRFHYVVIVAWASGRVLFHDPSVGPFQVKDEAEFQRLWKASEGWALILTPGTSAPLPKAPPKEEPTRPAPTTPTPSPCDPLIDQGIAAGRGADPEVAVPVLTAVLETCPGNARALMALAGVRFRQEQWKEAARIARQATQVDPTDQDTWRLLATSLYLAEEREEAIVAWNQVQEPRIDRIQIEGLIRTRQDVAAAVLGLNARDVLTLDSWTLAARRLDQMPTSTGARVTYRPARGGRADIVASVGESPLIEPFKLLVLRLGVEAAARRESALALNSPTGRGERVEVGGRFATNRPAAWAKLETPRLGGLPGVVTLTGLWDRQTYRPLGPEGVDRVVETRRRGAVDWSSWTSASTAVEVGLAVDRFAVDTVALDPLDDPTTFVAIRGGVDRRRAKDRLAVLADAAAWRGVRAGRGFTEFGGSVVLRSRVRPEGWVFHARADARRASDKAPFAIWPGAGKGPGRPLLLRASRLHSDGEVTGDAFGRGLLHATVEVERAVAMRGPARLGVAAFVDWAKPWDNSVRTGAGPDVFALGVGLRLRVFSTAAFRADVARRPNRGGWVVSAGVIPVWPR
ncbi:MAG: C39 family peptidase [Vicinamibacteria bacterium]|nr:C39 family peptidase [Vicinamibacteria bacterium]